MERKSYDRDLPKGREVVAAIAIRDGEMSDGGCRMMSTDVVVHWTHNQSPNSERDESHSSNGRTIGIRENKTKAKQVNLAAQTHLSPVQDHVNFTLQQAYFKCAYECFDRRRSQQEISNCVENCSVPVVTAQQRVEGEMARFQALVDCWVLLCKLALNPIFGVMLKSHNLNLAQTPGNLTFTFRITNNGINPKQKLMKTFWEQDL
ncbi:hypothetical protein GBA52_003903 [Prunus armeniaca]|nr:hypothetical protein GBA52_003903 [Prunus armeniaca]